MTPCANPPSGLFPNRNFMTPDIGGYYKLRKGYAELSGGTGIDNEPIYGVTVRPEKPDDRRSQMFHSLKEAKAYIESMS